MIDKLAWIYVKDKKCLCCKSDDRDKYYLPGGQREQGESDIEALARKIKEEASVDLLIDTIKYYGEFEAQAHAKPEGTFVKMTCYSGEFVGELKPDSEVEKIGWLDTSNRDSLSDVGKLIFEDLKEKGLID